MRTDGAAAMPAAPSSIAASLSVVCITVKTKDRRGIKATLRSSNVELDGTHRLRRSESADPNRGGRGRCGDATVFLSR